MLVVPTGEIALTCAPSCTPVNASSVIVAAWPTLTLVISDSLNATVIVIVRELTISAKRVVARCLEEFEEPEELELPRLPAVVLEFELEEELDDELLLELLEESIPPIPSRRAGGSTATRSCH